MNENNWESGANLRQQSPTNTKQQNKTSSSSKRKASNKGHAKTSAAKKGQNAEANNNNKSLRNMPPNSWENDANFENAGPTNNKIQRIMINGGVCNRCKAKDDPAKRCIASCMYCPHCPAAEEVIKNKKWDNLDSNNKTKQQNKTSSSSGNVTPNLMQQSRANGNAKQQSKTSSSSGNVPPNSWENGTNLRHQSPTNNKTKQQNKTSSPKQKSPNRRRNVSNLPPGKIPFKAPKRAPAAAAAPKRAPAAAAAPKRASRNKRRNSPKQNQPNRRRTAAKLRNLSKNEPKYDLDSNKNFPLLKKNIKQRKSKQIIHNRRANASNPPPGKMQFTAPKRAPAAAAAPKRAPAAAAAPKVARKPKGNGKQYKKGTYQEKNGKIKLVNNNGLSSPPKPGLKVSMANVAEAVTAAKRNGKQNKAPKKKMISAANVATRNRQRMAVLANVSKPTSSSKKLFGHTHVSIMELLKKEVGIIFKPTEKIGKKEFESLGGDIVSVAGKGHFKLYYKKNGKLHRIFKKLSPYTYIVKGSTGQSLQNKNINTQIKFLEYYPKILNREINKQERNEIINNNNM